MAVDSIRGARTEEVQAAGTQTSTLFREHSRMVYGLCLALLRNPTDADDASQATFVSAYRALLGGTHPREPAAWLATIARNECASRVRAGMREPLPLPDTELGHAEGPEGELERRAAVEQVRLAISELPDRQREAVVLRDLYGLNYTEVGAALGMSVSSVESLLFRARRRLRLSLKPFAGGVLVVPVAVREGVARAVPAISSGGSLGGAPAGGVGLGLLAKLVSGPAAVKAAAAVAAGSFVVAGTTHGSAPTPAATVDSVALPAGIAVATAGRPTADARRDRSGRPGEGSGAARADRGADRVQGESASARGSGGSVGDEPIGAHHGAPGSPGSGTATEAAAPAGGEHGAPSGSSGPAGGTGSGGPPDESTPASSSRGTGGSARSVPASGKHAGAKEKGPAVGSRAGGPRRASVPGGNAAGRVTASGGRGRKDAASVALLARTRSAAPGQGREPGPDETRRDDAGRGETGPSNGASGNPEAPGRSARDEDEPGAPGSGNAQGAGPGNGGSGNGGQGGGPGNGGSGNGGQGGGPGNGGQGGGSGNGDSRGGPDGGSQATTTPPAGKKP